MTALINLATRCPQLRTLCCNFQGLPELTPLLKIARRCPRLETIKFYDEEEERPIPDRAVEALRVSMLDRCPNLKVLVL
jgi:hypothetical protein